MHGHQEPLLAFPDKSFLTGLTMPIAKSKALPAARVTDGVAGGIIIQGEETVLIGGTAKPVACKECKAKRLKGNPVNVSYGSKILRDEIDFALPAPMPFAWQRFYASDTPQVGILGQGWRTPVELHIDANEHTTSVFDMQGRTITFEALSPGEEQFCPSEGLWLARGTADQAIAWGDRWQWLPKQYRHNPHSFIAATSEGSYLVFDAVLKPKPTADNPHLVSAGRFDLIATISRHGYTTSIAWMTVRNEAGHSLRIPEWITDSADRVYRLHYAALPADYQRDWNAHHTGIDPGIRLKGISLAHDPLRDANASSDRSVLRDKTVREWLVQYSFSAAGDLITVLDGDGDALRSFAYEQHMMTRQQTPAGMDVAYRYDRLHPEGRVVREMPVGGPVLDFSYTDNETRITDSLQRTTIYRFEGDAGLRRPVEIMYPDGGIVQMTYTRDGRVSEFIDPLGRKTHFLHNSQGEQTSSTSPLGHTHTRYIDQSTGLVTGMRNAQGRGTHVKHDGKGNIVEVIGSSGGVTKYEYAHARFTDRPTAVIDARGGRKLFAYDGLGQLLTYTDCGGRTTTWRRDSKGRLLAIDSADGKRQTYRRDRKGRIIAAELQDGHTESFEYDPAGRLAQAPDDQGRTVALTYDRFDRVTESRTWIGEGEPDRHDVGGWASTRHVFDEAGRLIRLTNPAGALMTFGYDPMDRIVSESGFDGKRCEYRYNQAGELTRQIEAAGTSGALEVEHEHDAGGRLIARRLPSCDGAHADTHRFEYNALNQLTCATTLRSRVDFLYDDRGHLTAETQSASDGSSFTLHFGYDILGNRIETVLPDGQSIGVLMAGAGHWHQVAFNGHALVDIERDSLYRETCRTFGSGAYLPVDQPLTRTLGYTAGGQIGNVSFSRHGRVSEQWGHQYDSHGLMTVIEQDVAALRKAIRYSYDAQQRLDAWEIHQARHTERLHTDLVFERIQAQTYAYDQAGNAIAPGTVVRTDPVSNMPVYASPEQWADQVKAHAHNPDFNLLGMQPVRANRMAQLGTVRHEHDERGNVIQRTTPEGTWTFAWNALNQMCGSRFTPAGSSAPRFDASYFYDAFGRRIGKNVIDLATLTQLPDGGIDFDKTRHSPTRFIWDGDRMLQEIQAGHARTIVYDPGSFVPLAHIIQPVRAGALPWQRSPPDEFPLRWMEQRNRSMMLASADVPDDAKAALRAEMGKNSPYRNEAMQLHLFITDHLGTPVRMLDAGTHQALWEREQDPWGNTLSERWHPKLEKSYLPALRFQGQQADWETGLYYNRHRYYDPGMHRYVSQDPIGILGGLNVYGYVGANPVQWVDPLGLDRWGDDVGQKWLASDPKQVCKYICDGIKNSGGLIDRDKYLYDLSWRDAEHYLFARDTALNNPSIVSAAVAVSTPAYSGYKALKQQFGLLSPDASPPSGAEVLWGLKGTRDGMYENSGQQKTFLPACDCNAPCNIK